MPTITLTKEQLEHIKREMTEQVEMLTDNEVQALAHKLNDHINLPFISHEKEYVVFIKVIKWIDKLLYQMLPNEYYGLVKDTTDGISEEEADKIEKRLTPLINNVVNIPVLTEKMEGKLISLILKFIIKAMVKGFKLEEV